MKYQEFTFQMIGLAILRRWKRVVVTFLLFLALGVASGFLFANRASADGSGSAVQWQPVDFESVTFDLEYYTSCHTSLSQESRDLYTYVNTVHLDSTITKEQNQQLLSLCEEITKYQQEVLSEVGDTLLATDAFYVPFQLRQDAVKEYTRLRNNTQDQMVKAESAIALLQSIGGLTSTNENINDTYSSLLCQAAQYGQLQLDLDKYNWILDRLENNYTLVQADSREMESQLDQAVAELNELGEKCYQVVQEIALENHLNITIDTKTNSSELAELTVLINDTTRPATQKEAFIAFVLFFALAGLCVGGFAALCKEGTGRKKGLPA